MKIKQIRSATNKIFYGGKTFLLDPWLEQQYGLGFSIVFRENLTWLLTR